MTNDALKTEHNTGRIINFGAGPAQYPLEVIEELQAEFSNCYGTRRTIKELSHRSTTFAKIIQEAEQNIRDILSIPDSYAVLFLHNGASHQFRVIPEHFLNLKRSETADYLVTGYWSERAAKAAEKFGTVNLVIPEQDKYIDVPAENTWKLTENASYFYYCSNETIHGIEFDHIPTIVPKDTPIICDMSSNFLTRSFDVTKFGAIFASAQKNFGESGLTLVIVRKDLVGKINNESIDDTRSYKVQMDHGSMYNTPPISPIYDANKMFNWMKRQGGLKAMDQLSEKKSALVYAVIDQSNGFYVNMVSKKYRSRVNIPFRIATNGTPNEKLEQLFLDEALKSDMDELKGHRTVGGIRVSLYNGITLQETTKLADFMRTFQKNNI
ncbi:unnamed protein product [Adineta steineri]|uniref:phosphoserine transaminase n=1 Tax=Adineta steineri TaxID=433720 RepID=A0A819WPX8_9BILA|nr:unnamed protein product [Adineta steineri]CAF4130070.1 unnamed protein product [Adineta steineri]